MMTMMLTGFEPIILSPLSESLPGPRVTPAPPSPTKRTSDRVSTLLLDNLKMFEAPLSNKAHRFQLQPTTVKSALMESALQRFREKAAAKSSPPLVVPASPRARRAPRLPQRQPSPRSSPDAPRRSSEPALPKVDMPTTPIRSPPERSNSGLARCA